MEKDKTFNLQLTIHKLEEELALYRNGTTAEEMFDLIKEKEVEIDELRSALHSKENKLKQISKSSFDLLEKYDAIVIENEKLLKESNNMTTQLTAVNRLLNEAETQSQQIMDKSTQDIKQLTYNATELTEINIHLKKCLANKDSIIKDLKESIVRYEAQLEGLKKNEDQVNVLKKTVADRDLSLQRMRESLADSDVSVEKLQKRCADLVSEKADKFRQLDQERQDMISHVQKFRESMTANITQRDEALRRKEEKIKELNFQVTLLGQDCKLKTQKCEDVAAERDAHWKGKVLELENKLAESERAASGSAPSSAALKADNEALRVRLMDLEEKLHRQDQALKRRVLQERSGNIAPTLHYDPADMAVVKPSLSFSTAAAASTSTAQLQSENVSQQQRSHRGVGGGASTVPREFAIYSDSKY